MVPENKNMDVYWIPRTCHKKKKRAALNPHCLMGHLAAMVEFQSAWDDPMYKTPSELPKS